MDVLLCSLFLFFFFSSRRRHTRCLSDWSSDVCSSDLFFLVIEILQANLVEPLVFGRSIGVSGPGQLIAMLFWAVLWGPIGLILSTPKIGRASCREGV